MRDDGLIPRGNRTSDDRTELATEWLKPENHPYNILMSSYDMLISYKDQIYSGFNTPRFRNRISQGDLIRPTPWYQFDSQGEILSGVLDYRSNYPVMQRNWYSNQHGARIVPDTWVLREQDVSAYAPYIYDQYVAQAANAIYSQGFDALTFLAELPEVYRLYKSILQRMLSALLPTYKSGKTHLNALSCAYLGFRYGWAPLLRDIASLNDMLKNLEDGKVKRHTRTAKGRTEVRHGSTGGVQGGCFYYQLDTVDDVKVSIHGFVAADICIPSLQFNPIVTLWEKIPFSFLLDWVINVGKTIGALSLLELSEQYVAAKGFKVEVQRRTSLLMENPNEYFVDGTMYRHTLATGTITRREPCNIPLLPRFKFNIKDPRQIVDLLALAVTRFKGWR